MSRDEEREEMEDSLDDDALESGDLEAEIDEMLFEEWCPNCKEIKPHAIISKDKIACSACNFEHLREIESDGPVVQCILTDEDKADEASLKNAWKRLTDVDASELKAYSIRLKLEEGDVIKHSKFGVGIVVTMTDSTKAEVLFEDGLRRLVCGK